MRGSHPVQRSPAVLPQRGAQASDPKGPPSRQPPPRGNIPLQHSFPTENTHVVVPVPIRGALPIAERPRTIAQLRRRLASSLYMLTVQRLASRALNTWMMLLTKRRAPTPTWEVCGRSPAIAVVRLRQLAETRGRYFRKWVNYATMMHRAQARHQCSVLLGKLTAIRTTVPLFTRWLATTARHHMHCNPLYQSPVTITTHSNRVRMYLLEKYLRKWRRWNRGKRQRKSILYALSKQTMLRRITSMFTMWMTQTMRKALTRQRQINIATATGNRKKIEDLQQRKKQMALQSATKARDIMTTSTTYNRWKSYARMRAEAASRTAAARAAAYNLAVQYTTSGRQQSTFATWLRFATLRVKGRMKERSIEVMLRHTARGTMQIAFRRWSRFTVERRQKNSLRRTATAMMLRTNQTQCMRVQFHKWMDALRERKARRVQVQAACLAMAMTSKGLQRMYFSRLMKYAHGHKLYRRKLHVAETLAAKAERATRVVAFSRWKSYARIQAEAASRTAAARAAAFNLAVQYTTSGRQRSAFATWLRFATLRVKGRVKERSIEVMLRHTARGTMQIAFRRWSRFAVERRQKNSLRRTATAMMLRTNQTQRMRVQFHKWMDALRERKARRVQMQAACLAMAMTSKGLQRMYFSRLMKYARGHKLYRRKLHVAETLAAKAERATRVVAFLRWKSYARIQAEAASRTAAARAAAFNLAVQYTTSGRQRSTFATWLRFATLRVKGRVKERSIEVMLRHTARGTMQIAFRRWSRFAVERRQKNSLRRTATAMMLRTNQTQCMRVQFHKWMDALRERKARRVQMQAACLAMAMTSKGLQRMYFSRLMKYARGHKLYRRKLHVAETLAAKAERATRVVAFSRWKSYARIQAEAASRTAAARAAAFNLAVQYTTSGRQRSAFATWLRFATLRVKGRVKERSIEVMLRHTARGTMQIAFRRWSRFAVERRQKNSLRRTATAMMLRTNQTQCMRVQFHKWMDALRERKARRVQMQAACLAMAMTSKGLQRMYFSRLMKYARGHKLYRRKLHVAETLAAKAERATRVVAFSRWKSYARIQAEAASRTAAARAAAFNLAVQYTTSGRQRSAFATWLRFATLRVKGRVKERSIEVMLRHTARGTMQIAFRRWSRFAVERRQKNSLRRTATAMMLRTNQTQCMRVQFHKWMDALRERKARRVQMQAACLAMAMTSKGLQRMYFSRLMKYARGHKLYRRKLHVAETLAAKAERATRVVAFSRWKSYARIQAEAASRTAAARAAAFNLAVQYTTSGRQRSAFATWLRFATLRVKGRVKERSIEVMLRHTARGTMQIAFRRWSRFAVERRQKNSLRRTATAMMLRTNQTQCMRVQFHKWMDALRERKARRVQMQAACLAMAMTSKGLQRMYFSRLMKYAHGHKLYRRKLHVAETLAAKAERATRVVAFSRWKSYARIQAEAASRTAAARAAAFNLAVQYTTSGRQRSTFATWLRFATLRVKGRVKERSIEVMLRHTARGTMQIAFRRWSRFAVERRQKNSLRRTATAMMLRTNQTQCMRVQFHKWMDALRERKARRVQMQAACLAMATTSKGLQRMYFSRLMKYARGHKLYRRKLHVAETLAAKAERATRVVAFSRWKSYARIQAEAVSRTAAARAAAFNLAVQYTTSGRQRSAFATWLRFATLRVKGRVKERSIEVMLRHTARGTMQIAFRRWSRFAVERRQKNSLRRTATAMMLRTNQTQRMRVQFHKWMDALRERKARRVQMQAACLAMATTSKGLQRMYFSRLMKYARGHKLYRRKLHVAETLAAKAERATRVVAFLRWKSYARIQAEAASRTAAARAAAFNLAVQYTTSGRQRSTFATWLRFATLRVKGRVKERSLEVMLRHTARGTMQIAFRRWSRFAVERRQKNSLRRTATAMMLRTNQTQRMRVQFHKWMDALRERKARRVQMQAACLAMAMTSKGLQRMYFSRLMKYAHGHKLYRRKLHVAETLAAKAERATRVSAFLRWSVDFLSLCRRRRSVFRSSALLLLLSWLRALASRSLLSRTYMRWHFVVCRRRSLLVGGVVSNTRRSSADVCSRHFTNGLAVRYFLLWARHSRVISLERACRTARMQLCMYLMKGQLMAAARQCLVRWSLNVVHRKHRALKVLRSRERDVDAKYRNLSVLDTELMTLRAHVSDAATSISQMLEFCHVDIKRLPSGAVCGDALRDNSVMETSSVVSSLSPLCAALRCIAAPRVRALFRNKAVWGRLMKSVKALCGEALALRSNVQRQRDDICQATAALSNVMSRVAYENLMALATAKKEHESLRTQLQLSQHECQSLRERAADLEVLNKNKCGLEDRLDVISRELAAALEASSSRELELRTAKDLVERQQALMAEERIRSAASNEQIGELQRNFQAQQKCFHNVAREKKEMAKACASATSRTVEATSRSFEVEGAWAANVRVVEELINIGKSVAALVKRLQLFVTEALEVAREGESGGPLCLSAFLSSLDEPLQSSCVEAERLSLNAQLCLKQIASCIARQASPEGNTNPSAMRAGVALLSPYGDELPAAPVSSSRKLPPAPTPPQQRRMLSYVEANPPFGSSVRTYEQPQRCGTNSLLRSQENQQDLGSAARFCPPNDEQWSPEVYPRNDGWM